QPGYLIVLTVGVVVAELRVAEFVTSREHGRAAAAQQHRERISAQAAAQRVDGRVVGLPFRAAVPAVVVVGAVGVVPAVALIVLFVVGIQVIEREAVVTGQEIDRRILPLIGR